MRVGIIGYGDAGGSFACAAYVAEGIEPVFIGGRNVEKAAARAERFGIDSGTNDDLLARDDIDCVAISTPPGRHADDALPFIEKGLAVLIEKPMALTVADCQRIIDAAEKSGSKIMVTQTRRYTRMARLTRKLVESGDYGKVIHVFIGSYHDYFTAKRSGWQLDWALSGGGVVMNPFVHMIDTARWLACSEVKDLQGKIGFHKPGYDIEGNAQAFLAFENDATGLVDVQGYGHRKAKIAEVLCEKASIVQEEDSRRVDIYRDSGVREVHTIDNRIYERDGIRAHDGYTAHLQEMRDAIANGAPITSDGRNGMRNVELCCQLLEQNGVQIGVGRKT